VILILSEEAGPDSDEYRHLMARLSVFRGIKARAHIERGSEKTLTEVYLIGDTKALDIAEMRALPGVARVVRVSEEYRILGRHKDDSRPDFFDYNGVRFGQDTLHVFAGLCAVDNPASVEATFRALRDNGQICARMGAYKPRTSPYAFQGHGRDCLAYVFELAGKYGMKAVAMEITHESHLDEIRAALKQTGNPTGVLVQIGTRNAQNFELLKLVGRQQDFPVLLKRGFGITLDEALNAAEYLASEGNRRVVFGLRGVKSALGEPHRNLVDFAHVPVVKRLTRMPVCVDPSHSVGSRAAGPDGVPDLAHAAAQGVAAGANMVLVDFHPDPARALVDGPQALPLEELPRFLEDVRLAREAYLKRAELWRGAPRSKE
jgi:3-deoxy-7-phosphoheptulonate synthase